jgi:hypothetical protein
MEMGSKITDTFVIRKTFREIIRKKPVFLRNPA